MTTRPMSEISNVASHEDGDVEMTNDLPAEHDSVDAESTSCDDAIVRTPTKPQENRSLASDEDTQLISPWSSIRDEDSQSSASSGSSWGTEVYTDMRYTMLSNAFFFTGACIQTYMTISGLQDALKDAQLGDDDIYGDDDTILIDDDYVLTTGDKAYYFFYSLGPFLYIINSIIDVRWATEYAESPWSWSFWCQGFRRKGRPSTVEIQTPNQQDQYQRIVDIEINSTDETNSLDDSSSYSSISSSAASTERFDLMLQIIAAIVFGLGAAFEFYSTLLDDKYEDEDEWDDDAYLIKKEHQRKWYVSNYKTNFIGMHLYLLSGLIQLFSQRKSYRNASCCRRLFSCGTDDIDCDESESSDSTDSTDRLAYFLQFLGTILFVCGTFLDFSISYLDDPIIHKDLDPNKRLDMNQVTQALFDLTSSMLWNIDAILYITADVLLYSLHKKDSKGRKWLFKKRISCSCNEEEDEDTMEKYDDVDDFVLRDNKSPMPMIPKLDSSRDASKPLLKGRSSVTSYSSL